jgi:hypothetical protein
MFAFVFEYVIAASRTITTVHNSTLKFIKKKIKDKTSVLCNFSLLWKIKKHAWKDEIQQLETLNKLPYSFFKIAQFTTFAVKQSEVKSNYFYI